MVLQAVRNYADNVREKFPVVKAFLFGSWAKGTATKYRQRCGRLFFSGKLWRQKPDRCSD
ncbi:MAG: nucleotidyltransferase domain-containing protein [Deltaproteobacteria bacterium]|nr:nucleotidyltransferase domain-containing protein [Deltaproteobacteria bacterium]